MIFERDRDRFDERHSVYLTRHLSKEKIEELATHCTAKFLILDAFIDQTKVFPKRTNGKTPLFDYFQSLLPIFS